jgi:coenzyme F420-0:L-glutamate ligase / coenzyme F420-1:gamma-L-glutamate ligase
VLNPNFSFLFVPKLTLTTLEGIGEIMPGQSIADVITDALASNALLLRAGDVVVICQKIVSKAENRYVKLATVTPSDRANELADLCQKDPRLVELVLRESSAVLRCVKDVLIVRHRLGFIVANAGIDQSNIPDAAERALLLPRDPDASAAAISAALAQRLGARVGVIISDSFGRPWRMGVCGTAIGCAGLNPLIDLRGKADRFGRALRVTQVAVADEIAAAATLIMGEADEGRPIVLVSGVSDDYFSENGSATQLLRPAAQDLFL